MSAIFGILTYDGTPVRQEWLDRMRNALARWGPHAQHSWRDRNVGLGHCLLAVAPESEHESQPLAAADGQIRGTFAGVLADRESLCRQLDVDEARIDGTLFLHAYLRWGEDCLVHLDGEFSAAVYDGRCNALWVAQSRVASQPLYFVQTPRLFAFSTHIVPLLSLPGVEKRLDHQGFVRACAPPWYRDGDTSTCFMGIEELPAASCLRVGTGGLTHRVYWQPDFTRVTPFSDEREVHHEILRLMRRAVRRWTRTPHKTACLLSGGLDSSSLACLAAENARIVAVSSVLPVGAAAALDGPDERPHIDLMARHLGVEVEYVHPPASPSAWEVTDEAFELEERPLLSARHYLYRALYDAAHRQGARVVLDGCYGEAGPSHHGNNLMSLRMFLHGQWVALARELCMVTRTQRVSLGRTIWREIARPLAQSIAHPSGPEIYPFELLVPYVRMHPSVGRARPPSRSPWRFLLPRAEPLLGEPAFWNARSRAHRFAMTSAVQALPFRDRLLRMYCAGLPMRLTRRNGLKRALIRGAMAGLLPRQIALRTSKGAFSPDYANRLRDALPWARERCEAARSHGVTAALMDLDALQADLHNVTSRPHSTSLFQPLQWGLMAIQFLDWFDRVGPSPFS